MTYYRASRVYNYVCMRLQRYEYYYEDMHVQKYTQEVTKVTVFS